MSLVEGRNLDWRACNILGLTEQVQIKGETDSSLTEALNGYKIIKKDSFSAF